jgi:tetratricopeptide (TPR) repeat protein
MRFEDEYDDLSRRIRVQGVSPGWRLAAILLIVAAGVLLLMVIGLGFGFIAYVQTAQRQQSFTFAPNDAQVPVDRPVDPEPANPPYPLVADLQPNGDQDAFNEPGVVAKKTARERFLELGEQIWTPQEDSWPRQVAIAPDGKHLAYLDGEAVLVGTIDGAMAWLPREGGNIKNTGALPRMKRGLAAERQRGTALRSVGRFTWSSDSRYLYFADTDGFLGRHDVPSGRVERLALVGDSPVPVPTEPNKIIFRRSRPSGKVELPGFWTSRDPSEVVLGGIGAQQVRVLASRNEQSWTPLAVSPDGKRLLLDASLRMQPGYGQEHRLHLLDLQAGQLAQPKPLGPTCSNLLSVCWEADSRAFVAAHTHKLLPPDCWEDYGTSPWGAVDLFRYEVDTGHVTRLSRGGSFDAPVVAGDALLFLSWTQGQPRFGWRMIRMPLAKARLFGEQNKELPARTVEAWSELLEGVLKDAGMDPDVQSVMFTDAKAAQLGEVFAKAFRARFQSDPPGSLRDWDRLHRELGALELPAAARLRARIVLGAGLGEYLRRRHQAIWRLSSGPLPQAQENRPERREENPFGVVLNPFMIARFAAFGRPGGAPDDDDGPPPNLWFVEALRQAQGRPLVLTNDETTGRKAIQELSDADLTRALELLKNRQGEEADRLLLGLTKKKQHEANIFLALHIGKLLHEHQRHAALRQLMEPLANRQPPDPHIHNLLGLAQLDADPQAAIASFKIVLRCNLFFDAAYFNLSQAYEKTKNRQAARECLKRVLRLMPYSPSAADAQQRLAAMQWED